MDQLRLTLVTDRTQTRGRELVTVVGECLAAGLPAVQVREKDLGAADLALVCRRLRGLTLDTQALLIVNDRVDVALASGAGGVHVGQADELDQVRDRIGPGVVLGVSVHDAEQARAAEVAGADYLGATVWPTPTKPDAFPHGLDGVRVVVAATSLPVVGIGGIGPANAAEVLAAGAAGVAVISAVGAAEDPVAATRVLAEVVGRWRAGER